MLLRSIASTSRVLSRGLSTSAPVSVGGFKRAQLGNYDLADLEVADCDEPTKLGWLRLLEIDDTRELLSKMTLDAAALSAQAKPFQKPKGTIRITSTYDLSTPNSPYHVKRVMIAPLSALPLKTPEAIQRLKLLAGPRWTPGYPGRGEFGDDALGNSPINASVPPSEHGFVKIAEERYPEARMNRKAVNDILERLVAAANDPKSPLPADAPVDTRHLLARQRKKKQRTGLNNWARVEALKRRPEVVGGVRGFPKEWLAPKEPKEATQQ